MTSPVSPVALLDRFEFPPGSRLRLVGVGVSNFLDADDEEETAAADSPLLFPA